MRTGRLENQTRHHGLSAGVSCRKHQARRSTFTLNHFYVFMLLWLYGKKCEGTTRDQRVKEKRGEPSFPLSFHITIKNHQPRMAGFSCISVGACRRNATLQLFCGIWKRLKNPLVLLQTAVESQRPVSTHIPLSASGVRSVSSTFSRKTSFDGYLR